MERWLGILLTLVLLAGCTSSDRTSFVSDEGSDPGTPTAITPSEEDGGGEEDICLLPKAAGTCEAAFPAFWYSHELGECLEFTYGGCEGNANRFDTLEECQKACMSPEEEGGEVT